jgi:hypothetical protein
MKTLLMMPDPIYADVTRHLLPDGALQEQAAFLFARVARSDSQVMFTVIAAATLGPSDLAVQEEDSLELTDSARAWMIKRAHDLGASLIETHSHLGPWPAAFSLYDHAGLRETVPHMWWRLRKRPYVALVFAQGGFDALVWLDDPRNPCALDGLVAGRRLLRPTNLSLEHWQ